MPLLPILRISRLVWLLFPVIFMPLTAALLLPFLSSYVVPFHVVVTDWQHSAGTLDLLYHICGRFLLLQASLLSFSAYRRQRTFHKASIQCQVSRQSVTESQDPAYSLSASSTSRTFLSTFRIFLKQQGHYH